MERRSTDRSGTIISNEIDVGKTVTSSLGYRFTYDTRRSGLNPNAGVLFEWGQDFAGVGGDNRFVKSTVKVVGQTFAFNEEVVLRATFEGGALNWSSGDNRATDRFILGPNIIRGFEPGGIGPRQIDAANNVDDALGGNFYAALRFDADFPLGLPEEYGIRGGLFYDIGNLWDLTDSAGASGANVFGESGSARHVIGVSILWDTPIGPLRFNFSNALKKRSFDKEQQFDLTLSTRF